MKITVATSAITGNAMIAIVKAGPLMGRDRVTVGLLFLWAARFRRNLWPRRAACVGVDMPWRPSWA
jgi:hypothetical protein